MAEGFTVDSKTGKATILKDPNAVLDYTFNWTSWLNGDTIQSNICSITPSNPQSNASLQGSTNNSTHVTAWVEGGTPGETITLRCRITTAAGRTDDRSVYLKVKER